MSKPQQVTSTNRGSRSWASSAAARRSMQSNRSRDTGPELAVRRILHAAGLRYRVDYSPLANRRRADVVFTRQRLAVFIDGCFWHGCPQHATLPATNSNYWLPKLRRNVDRDRESDALLSAAGWRVLRYWEHKDATSVAEEIIAIVRDPGSLLTALPGGSTLLLLPSGSSDRTRAAPQAHREPPPDGQPRALGHPVDAPFSPSSPALHQEPASERLRRRRNDS